MKRKNLWCSALVFLAGVAGCSASPAESDSGSADSEQAIVGGRVASDDAVVALDLNGEAVCTGTLVSPRVVLTARHCVSITSEEVMCPSRRVQVVGERDPKTIAVRIGDALPGTFGAYGLHTVVPDDDTLCGSDIAAIVLDRAVAGVTPASVADSAPHASERIRFVGFGQTGDEGAFGRKRARRVSVIGVAPHEVLVGESTCHGDSGGPAFSSTGKVVAVVSRGGPSCEGDDTRNIATRADVFGDLVARAQALADESPTAKAARRRARE